MTSEECTELDLENAVGIAEARQAAMVAKRHRECEEHNARLMGPRRSVKLRDEQASDDRQTVVIVVLAFAAFIIGIVATLGMASV